MLLSVILMLALSVDLLDQRAAWGAVTARARQPTLARRQIAL